MKVILINTDEYIGGAAKVANSLRNNLEHFGHKVTYFVANKQSRNAKTKVVPKNYWRSLIANTLATDVDFYPSDSILKTKAFREADIVHCHNLHGYYFSLSTFQKMCQLKPVIWTLHDLWAVTAHSAHPYDGIIENGFYHCRSLHDYPALLWPNYKYLELRKRLVYQQSEFTLVSPSIWLKNKLSDTVLDNKRLVHIPNGINNSTFRPALEQNRHRISFLPKDKRILLFIADGGLGNQFKGGKYIYSLIKLIDPHKYHFLCIGANDTRCKLPNVTYVPYITDNNVLAQFFSMADLLIFPSEAENFPLVVLEAMACGLPVVSFDVGGVKEAVVHLKNGYISTHSTFGLAKGIEYIASLSNREKLKMRQENIKRVFKYYSDKVMTENYLSLYKFVTSGTCD